jgi:hypothetical protein
MNLMQIQFDRPFVWLSFQPADSLSLCKYKAYQQEIYGNEFGAQCNCDESSLIVSCYDPCDTCLGSSCGKYSQVIVFDPDIDEPVVSDKSCYNMLDGQVFCYVYSTSTCEISVGGMSCSSCELCGNGQTQACADCTNVQPGAIINEPEGTGLVGIFSEPLVMELFYNYANYSKWEVGSCTQRPTFAPTDEPTLAPSAASITPWTRATWIAAVVSFQIIASLF